MTKIRQIKQRVANISQIKKVTSALETVATTRLKKKENAILRYRPYAQGLKKMFWDLTLYAHPFHWLMQKNPGSSVCLVTINSDKGLCGAFNENIFGYIRHNYTPANTIIIAVGKKGIGYFKKNNFKIDAFFTEVNQGNITEVSSRIRELLIRLYKDKQISRAGLVFNRFRLHLLGRVEELQVLPPILAVPSQKNSPGRVLDFIYEPGPDFVLERLLASYLESQIKAAIMESAASEEMARMLAMKYATDNADELIDKMTRQYHKARQAYITREIIEVLTPQ
jgi:F-type H+-transporting ATPase subunit gamma